MTTWTLKTSCLDEEDAVHTFATKDEAVDFAVVWFVVGYDPDTNNTLGGSVPYGVGRDTADLIDALNKGALFYCPRFYETAELTPTSE